MIYLLLYAALCIVFAKINAIWIKDGKRIYHGVNGAIHLIAAGVGFWIEGWQVGIATLFVARLFFDVALNLFRGLAIDYVPAAPKSIIDKIEKKLFNRDGLTPKIIYLTIIVILLAVKYIK